MWCKTKWVPLLLLPLLVACQGTVQERLGITNRAPDEFQVVRRAPLVVPPDYGLTPPTQAVAESEAQQSQVARALVTGQAQKTPDGASASELALLSSTSIAAEPGIRTVLLEDVGSVRQIDESKFLGILDWQKPGFDGDQPLNSGEEADALQASNAAAKVVTNRINPSQDPTAAGAQ